MRLPLSIDVSHFFRLSVLTDVNLLQVPLDTALFPGVPSNVAVHDGFRNQHALTASETLAEVQNLMASKKTNAVTCVSAQLQDQADPDPLSSTDQCNTDWSFTRRRISRAGCPVLYT